MGYTVERKNIAPQLVAYGTGSGPANAIPQILGQILPKTMTHVTQKGGQLAGPPFTHYLSMGESIELEAGVPLRAKIDAGDDVQVGELPGGDVITTTHIGPYDQLNQAYQALAAYVAEKNLTPGNTMWEFYWSDPQEEPDPAKWKTEIFLPVS